MSDIIRRIESQAGVAGLADVLAERLSPTDLQSLLIEVYRRRAGRRSAADVLADYRSSRFARPSPTPPREIAAFARTAFDCLEGGWQAMALSPVAPFAACSAVAGVSQDWSIPTARTGEVASDPTNVLALEAALRRQAGGGDVHLAALERVVRPQAYRNAGALAHFTLLALVSAGRDRGSFRFEAEAIAAQLRVHLEILRRRLSGGWAFEIAYTCRRRTGAVRDARIEVLADVAAAFGATLVEAPERRAADTYYDGFCLHVRAGREAGTTSELVDLGTVAWGQRILSSRKERMVISGVGVDRVIALGGS